MLSIPFCSVWDELNCVFRGDLLNVCAYICVCFIVAISSELRFVDWRTRSAFPALPYRCWSILNSDSAGCVSIHLCYTCDLSICPAACLPASPSQSAVYQDLRLISSLLPGSRIVLFSSFSYSFGQPVPELSPRVSIFRASLLLTSAHLW